ncbi:hypothetical protein SDC9_172177 [bioreactor metagenome]|uniref:Uncharacterized protein n=1 Tax=bioreactor metagenome TaxID=1076179 RepID=A0A645GDM9_9ZZZZ
MINRINRRPALFNLYGIDRTRLSTHAAAQGSPFKGRTGTGAGHQNLLSVSYSYFVIGA